MCCRCLLKQTRWQNLHISALQREPCLLKTNSTQALFGDRIKPALTIDWYGNVCPQIISPQWSNARPNFPTKKCVGGAKFRLVSRLVHRVSSSSKKHLAKVIIHHIEVREKRRRRKVRRQIT